MMGLFAAVHERRSWHLATGGKPRPGPPLLREVRTQNRHAGSGCFGAK